MKRTQSGMVGLLVLLVSACAIAFYIFGDSLFSHKTTEELRATPGTIENKLQAVDAAKDIKKVLEEQSRNAARVQ